MVLLNQDVKTNESSQATSLTFQYGAIKPKTNTEHDSELAILTFQYGAIKPWRYH